jgi:hypothetical protein
VRGFDEIIGLALSMMRQQWPVHGRFDHHEQIEIKTRFIAE